MSPSNTTLERELNIKFRDQPMHKGRLVIGEIVFVEQKKQWWCFWFMDLIHTKRSKVYGDDALHALTTCLDLVSTFIRGTERDGWTIYWQKEGDHGGLTFPLSEKQSWLKKPTEGQK